MASTEEKSTNIASDSKFSFFRSLPANPYVFTGLAILAVLSSGFAIFTWLDSKATPELTFYANPARAVVVQRGKASDLAVTYRNEMVQGDISAVQIAIWNAGKIPIKRGDVLKPVVFSMASGSSILEATIRSPGRDVSNISLDQLKLKEGKITVNWDILERNDGAIIQVIYMGGPTDQINVSGIVIGQDAIRILSVDEADSSMTGSISLLVPGAFLVLIAGFLFFKIMFDNITLGGFKYLALMIFAAGLIFGLFTVLPRLYRFFWPKLPFVFD